MYTPANESGVSPNRIYNSGRESLPRIDDKSREIPTIPLAAWPIPALYGLAEPTAASRRRVTIAIA